MASAPPSATLARKRCAIATMGAKHYIFLVVPKPSPPPPPPAPEIENLMFFDSAPAPPPPAPPPANPQLELPPDTNTYAPGSIWRHGAMVIPASINGNGDLARSTDFDKTEYDSLSEVYSTCGPFESVVEFYATFGYVVLDKAYVLVASKVEHAAALPFHGTIIRVLDTKWIPLDLPGVSPLKISPQDRKKLHDFQNYPFNKGYYYSDEVDLRLQFPFVRCKDPHALPNFKCDWSESLRLPFRAASLRTACPVLVRGYAGERIVAMKDDAIELHMLLLGRQNSINPGPRYLGRGLNKHCGAGNDHVYEYILWTRRQNEDTVTFARHVILRGTIPVHWSTKVSMSISEPAMIFEANKSDVLAGSSTYFETTCTKLQQVMNIDSAGKTTRNPQVRCLSMLRLNAQNGEDILAKHFLDAVRTADPVVRQKYSKGSLDLVHVDWLNITKEYGIDVAVSTFWESAIGFLGKPGDVDDAMFTIGIVKADGEVDQLISQSRFLRINCADSLDRTNLGCFFTCLQASIGMLITLQIPFNSFKDERLVAALNPSDDNEESSPYAAAFAPVSGAKQTVPKPFLNTWTEARDPRKLPPAICRALAELYVYNGDCVAQLYTSSQAMHGNILRSLCGMKLTGSNAVIATQRKFENAFEDRNKFRHIELLLGRNHDVHFPSMSQVYLTRPVPYSMWACALIAVGIPKGTNETDVDHAIRESWDRSVVPYLRQTHNTPVESSALCFTITVHGSHWEESSDVFEETVRQVSFEELGTEDGSGDDLSPPVRSENIVVLQFDPNFCSVIDAPMLLRQHGCLSIKGYNSILAPYAYPIQVGPESGNNGMGGAVKSVGTSLKRGIKNLVRGLN